LTQKGREAFHVFAKVHGSLGQSESRRATSAKWRLFHIRVIPSRRQIGFPYPKARLPRQPPLQEECEAFRFRSLHGEYATNQKKDVSIIGMVTSFAWWFVMTNEGTF
jgi:hypothetical protein